MQHQHEKRNWVLLSLNLKIQQKSQSEKKNHMMDFHPCFGLWCDKKQLSTWVIDIMQIIRSFS